MSVNRTDRTSWQGKKVFFIVAVVALMADLWSKALAFAPQESNTVTWVMGTWLGLTQTMNEGVMWGAFPEASAFLPYVRIIAAGFVVYLARDTSSRDRLGLGALGLVLGGALGNIIDGFYFNAVRDFIYVDLDFPFFDPFPVFNVADSGICVGVALLLFSMGKNRGDCQASS